jgi:fido (protein-threonine AMPylation protein)
VDHPCPDAWSYEQHPRRKKLKERVADLLARLRSKKIDGLKVARDSRPIHGELFRDLTPPHFPYFAGHYRGEMFRCLATLNVGVQGDRRVGAPAEDVADRVSELEAVVLEAMAAADKLFASGTLSAEAKVLHIVGVACQVFDLFLQIHPFANGNGHASRFIMWAILGRYGFWPVRWSVEPRPSDPPYTPLLLKHRAGDRRPLVEFVLNCIK